MRDLIEQLNNLRQLSGNEQIDYLRSIASPLLKEVLEYTLDTKKKYKIDTKKYESVKIIISHRNYPLSESYWEGFKEHLDNLAAAKSANNNMIYNIKCYIEDCERADILRMVLFKDLRLGLGAKKIQSVWPDFCVTYPYMGCKPFNQKNLKGMKYPAYAQTKMDGSFCNVIVDMANKSVEYVSRQSKPQPMKGSLDKELLSICPIDDCHFTSKFVLTGEVLAWDKENNKPHPRKISNGILRRESKTQEELDSIHLVYWDFLPYDKFIENRWEVPYKDRYEWLKTRIGKSDRLHLVNTWTVNNEEEAMALFQEQYEQGEEGIVLKSLNQIWQDGKPSGQVKIKAEKTCELRMMSFEEGNGAYSGMCGSILCVSEDEMLAVNVKPRTPADAIEIWNNQDKYRNRILEVKFNEVIESDSKSLPSLYLPVFVEIRDDKAQADTYEYIKSLEEKKK